MKDCLRVGSWILTAIVFGTSHPAWAQADPQPDPETAPAASAPTRAQENVVRQAEDGFGVTIGRESIGIYTAGNVRGFSALAAGNARLEGLFFDQVAAPSSRIRRSTSIRVGLSALGHHFPTPTGVVDYSLIRPAAASVSTTFSADSYANAGLEVDFSLPLTPTIAVGGGAAVVRNEYANGSTSNQTVLAGTALLRVTPDVELQPFWSRTDTYDNTLGPAYSPAGNVLPPAVPRRRFFGQDWSQFEGSALVYGVLGRARFDGGWGLHAGVFRSVFLTDRDTFVLIDEIDADGEGRYLVFTDPPGKTASTSGELRLTRVFTEGDRAHQLTASVRGRERRQLLGGSDVQDYGSVTIGNAPVFPEPRFVFGEQSRDSVSQFSGGVAYTMRWEGVGELAAGLSRTDYQKAVSRPDSEDTQTNASPLLYYGSLALSPAEGIEVYAGYARGLEESGVAPQNATNRNEALPAILTGQRDAGLRWSIADDLQLVFGTFDIRKPYFSRDASGLFTQLGAIRNRGIELSLSGALTSRLRTVIGAVLLDPEVSGEGVALGRVGPRPIGLPRRKLDMNLDWVSPITALSFDIRVAYQSQRPATTLNEVYLPSRTLVDLGGRYRFSLAGNDATLRLTVGNLLDAEGYELFGPGTYDLFAGRTLSAYLAVDF